MSCSRAIQSCILLLAPTRCPPSLDQSLSFSHTGAICPLHTQLPVGYLSPAPGIFREAFLPELWLLPFSTSYLSFYYPRGISDLSAANTCTRSLSQNPGWSPEDYWNGVQMGRNKSKKGDKPWDWIFFHFIQLWIKGISTKITQVKESIFNSYHAEFWERSVSCFLIPV